ncbi:MFS transporter [Acidocella aromatica]|uniref:Putative MFS family arabinose efflux permease n=1 Tax=Acidocella aromatica TaxID=1303579 RepID=A0A840VL21_9PROT|nr:MFS transporter [Acidocella aromatica]MBB5373855.1 putative MFS family arabinose efflux permease [Acidocella aromatica]
MRLFFGMAGVGISVWAITIPFTKIRFGLDDGTLGLILFAGGLGGVLVIPLAGMALARWGSRVVLAAAGLAVGLLLPGLTVAPSPLLFTAILFVYGAMFGVLDISLNAQGAVVERLSGKLQMSGYHACYSLGTLVVALASSLLLRLGVTNAGCAVLAASTILLILSQTPRLAGKEEDPPADGKRFALPNRATLLLGICCFTCFMTEGVATDWSTIFLRFSRNMPLDTATLGYAAFAVAMTAARLSGDAVAARLGAPWVMRLGCAVAVLGFLLAILIPSGWMGVLGFGLVGFGTGNIAPLVFSAAARVPQMAAHHAMPAVVGLGYAGFLAGPVVIGLVANHLGLASALGIDAALLAAVFFLAETVA